jgi:thioredoxin-related protein
MDKINDWAAASEQARQARVPLVILVDQTDCPYCRRVEGEYFSAILAGGEFAGKALFGKISLDSGEYISLSGDQRVPTREFLSPFFRTGLTPTVLFLDAEGNQLVENMVGLTTPDFYGFYLEQSIRRAHALVDG